MTRPNRGVRWGRLCLLGLLGLPLLACQDQPTPDIPNRVLDRPTDVALICAQVVCEDLDGDGTVQDDECETQPLPLDQCERDTGTCASDNPHLIGFVANSERNEIAMFTKCDNRLVDMNIEAPGYNFIPAGILPTDLDASADGCRVLSANVGSCDLTVLDAYRLAAIGLGRGTNVDEPAELVSNLVPQRFDPDSGRWLPLGARPAEVLAVPRSLTQAPGLDPDSPLAGICDPLTRASAYVSFPSCNLVAEIDLQTGHVLQSRQFVGDAAGNVSVVDSGVTPLCPVECPVQFDGLPAGLPLVDENGPFPQALELVLEPVEPSQDPDPNDPNTNPEDPSFGGNYDAADQAFEGQSLFVGGLGSDILFELRIADTGQWDPVENQLRLVDASGIKRIRASPPVNSSVFGSDFAQFIYAVAGDGSTRVVARAIPFAPDDIGVECETQLDPNVIPAGTDLGCIPVGQSPTDGQPTERRGFARGPGIRPSGPQAAGQEITDWMFRKVYPGQPGTGPFAESGTVAVGITSGGRVVYSMINQSRASGETTVEDLGGVGTDPANLMDVRLYPHSLWPDPNFDTARGLPTVIDEIPLRSYVTSSIGPTRVLAPSLRQIDATYVDDERSYAQLDVVADYDGLGGRIYDEDVARIAVHDYRSWGGGGWSLEWEGTIPGTSSGTGRIACDNPGWQGGTCLVSEPDDARLLDQAAGFCDAGVLAGDKLVILGCREHAQCGDGRRCLRQSVAGGASTGICISAQAYEERAPELREICRNFISDPCGEAHREFTITKAFQNELWLQSMDQPLISYLSAATVPCETGSNNQQVGGTCECLPGYTEDCPGQDDPEVVDCCPDPNDPIPPAASVFEAEDRFICSNEQPEGGCQTNLDCQDLLGGDEWLCIEDRCRRPCENADECVFRRLPGPACFGEFLTYQVALRNAFRVSGPAGFRTDLIELDPDTGECRETQDTEISRLLTSRIPMPASDSPDDPDWLSIPICPTDTVEPSNPNPCRVAAPRALEVLFHNIAYEGEQVSALRYSNPVFSLLIDLASLESLTSDIPRLGQAWPAQFARFLRSRIARGYRQDFRLDSGYIPFASFMTLEGRPVTFPVRIIAAPQSNVAFVVDGSGPGSAAAIRGQVLRVFLGEQVLSDEAFIGVR